MNGRGHEKAINQRASESCLKKTLQATSQSRKANNITQLFDEQYTKCSRLLYLIASWIGEGRHLGLLKKLIDSTRDRDDVPKETLSELPNSPTPSWIWESTNADPFSLDFFAMGIGNCPGMIMIAPRIYLFPNYESRILEHCAAYWIGARHIYRGLFQTHTLLC